MNLLIDIGNSRAKIAVMMGGADGGAVIWSGVRESVERDEIEELVARYGVRRSIVCSTRGDVSGVVSLLKSVVGSVLDFDHTTPIPIQNSYATPESLGRDRLAAAVGATTLSEAQNQLIIDMGTAITIDLVTQAGGFEGGVISPGVTMRFRALNHYTASLPLCTPTAEVVETPRSTREAIEQGVMRGVEYELRGYISEIEKKYREIDIIFAGGDAKYFDKRIKNTIFAPSELIFVGLNRILEYNAE